MHKPLANFLIAVLVVLAPLAGVPERLSHPAPWIALVAAWLMFATQPQLGARGMVSDGRDRLSALGILVALVASFEVAVVDFGYRAEGYPAPGSVLILGGTAAIVAGLTLRIWAIRTLGRFFTATVRVATDQSVVRSGPYRMLRHPSYTGALLVVLGLVLLFGSLRGLVAVLALGIPAYVYRMGIEERALVEELGAPYRTYRERTWRLVPFVY